MGMEAYKIEHLNKSYADKTSSVEISTYLNQFYTLYTFLKSKEIDTVKCHNLTSKPYQFLFIVEATIY
jgi:hypothetical protein